MPDNHEREEFFIQMMNEATWRFVSDHADEDVRQLALRGCKDEAVDLPMALQQIQGRQTAIAKLPSWAAVNGIIYPTHLSMEQCSSELTAQYKAKIAASLNGSKQKLVDLTGGFGVDFFWMGKVFQSRVYVEQQPQLLDIASRNFATLGLEAETVCTYAVDYLYQLDHVSMIFLDPARRDDHGGRTYGIGDCSPNVLLMMDELLSKADHVMLKLSPMLDWRKAVADIGLERVHEVHIVSVRNECKELLLSLSATPCSDARLVCVNDGSCDEFPLSDTSERMPTWTGDLVGVSLYEPNTSLMKAGRYDELARRYQVQPLAVNSHLFASRQPVEGFPGRSFRIIATSSMNKRELHEKIVPLRQANITVRNFPMTVAALRQRLKLSEGGSNYVFATTLATGERILVVAIRSEQ